MSQPTTASLPTARSTATERLTDVLIEHYDELERLLTPLDGAGHGNVTSRGWPHALDRVRFGASAH